MNPQQCLTNGGTNLASLQQQQQQQQQHEIARKLLNDLFRQQNLANSMNELGSVQQPQGPMVSSIVPVSTASLVQQHEQLLRLQQGQKRKAGDNWIPSVPCSSQKLNDALLGNGALRMDLNSIGNQIAASQLELAARNGFFLQTNLAAFHSNQSAAPSSGNQLGVARPFSAFMGQNSAGNATACQVQHHQQQSLSSAAFGVDMSWADPTPILESASTSIPATASCTSSLAAAPLESQSNSLHEMEWFKQDPNKVRAEYLSDSPVNAEPSVLHQSVKLFPTDLNIVERAVGLNPNDITRKAPLSVVSEATRGDSKEKTKSASYLSDPLFGYPLNIALQHNASLEVVDLLVKKAPEVVGWRDGKDECGSVALVLRNWGPSKERILLRLIMANPPALRMTDRRRNTPLHIALSHGVGLPIVRVLCLLYPLALLQTNLSGEIPLQVAQRNSLCTEEELNYVHEAYTKELFRIRRKPEKSSAT
jgi:hypothetical protein